MMIVRYCISSEGTTTHSLMETALIVFTLNIEYMSKYAQRAMSCSFDKV